MQEIPDRGWVSWDKDHYGAFVHRRRLHDTLKRSLGRRLRKFSLLRLGFAGLGAGLIEAGTGKKVY